MFFQESAEKFISAYSKLFLSTGKLSLFPPPQESGIAVHASSEKQADGL